MSRQAETTIAPARARPAGPKRTPARFSVVYPPSLATSVDLGEERLLLGRSPEVPGELVIAHPTVSRKHLELGWDASLQVFTCQDLGSKNGSWVCAAALGGEPRLLHDGDVVRTGDVISVFETAPELHLPDPPEVSQEAIPGESAAIRRCRLELGHAAKDRSAVLLIGETGTGKELLAREVHRLSGRRGPFVAVNCAELTGELMESQLFGHARGAFTGATQAHQGLFRSAEGGTLFLDEIGELPEALQPKLLRALQESEIRPVGENRPVRVEVRVVAATNRDLAAAVAQGRFRRDLYARLALWEIHLPSLEQRRRDLLLWVEILHRRWIEERGRGGATTFSLDAEAAEAVLCAHWPENLRGLDRVVHRLAPRTVPGRALTRAELAPLLASRSAEVEAEAPDEGRPPPPTAEELRQVLAQYGGSVRAVARHYRRDRKQIYRWMQAFGLR